MIDVDSPQGRPTFKKIVRLLQTSEEPWLVLFQSGTTPRDVSESLGLEVSVYCKVELVYSSTEQDIFFREFQSMKRRGEPKFQARVTSFLIHCFSACENN